MRYFSPVLREWVARNEVAALRGFLVHVVRDIAEASLVSEQSGSVVQTVRKIEVQQAAAEVIDDVREVLRLDGGHTEKRDVVSKHIAQQKLDTLRCADAWGDDRITTSEVERD